MSVIVQMGQVSSSLMMLAVSQTPGGAGEVGGTGTIAITGTDELAVRGRWAVRPLETVSALVYSPGTGG